MKDFRELKVWQKGMYLFEEVVQDVEIFPKKEAVTVTSTGQRSSASCCCF